MRIRMHTHSEAASPNSLHTSCRWKTERIESHSVNGSVFGSAWTPAHMETWPGISVVGLTWRGSCCTQGYNNSGTACKNGNEW